MFLERGSAHSGLRKRCSCGVSVNPRDLNKRMRPLSSVRVASAASLTVTAASQFVGDIDSWMIDFIADFLDPRRRGYRISDQFPAPFYRSSDSRCRKEKDSLSRLYSFRP